jgi:hypothetical protein
MFRIALVISSPLVLIACFALFLSGALNLLSFTIGWGQAFVIVYFALWLLMGRDRTKQDAAVRRIKASLNAERAITDEEFLTPRPSQPEMLIEIRNAIAGIMDLAPQQVPRFSPLIEEIRNCKLELWFFFPLLASVLSSKLSENKPVTFPPESVKTVDDLANWIYVTYLAQDVG